MEKATAGGGSGRAKRFMRVIAAVVIALALFLLFRTLSRYDYEEIVASIAAIPASRLTLAFAFAAASYLALTCFDALALRYAGHPLPYWKVARASFISLSLGHNIGLAALSSGAIRYRFYSREGLDAEDVAKVILFCGATVGLGLATLGGLVIALRPGLAAQITGIGRVPLLALAVLSLAGPLVYVILAATLRRPLHIRSWSFTLPNVRLAAGQIVVGAVNFAFVAACLHQALSGIAEVPYLSVASVYVIATVATLITHAPGGLGVIEGTVVFLLPEAAPIGAVLVFRFVYFLVPLCIGSTLFAATELLRRRQKPADAATGGAQGASVASAKTSNANSTVSKDRSVPFRASA